MVKGWGKFLGARLLCWLSLPLLSSLAWADKVTEPMVLNADAGAIAVISLYETNPTTQVDAVKSFYQGYRFEKSDRAWREQFTRLFSIS